MSYTDYVIEALNKLSSTRKVEFSSDRKYCKIQCVNPDHKGGFEETPSLRVNLIETLNSKGKFSVGSAKCWSCSVFYPNWNKLTEALYRPDLALKNKDDFTESDKVSSFFSDEINTEVNEVEEDIDPIFLRDIRGGALWNSSKEWRGIEGKLLKSLKATLYFDSIFEIPMLYLPCMINNKSVGGVKARLEKSKIKGVSSYINVAGNWVKNRGLFPFDYSKNIIKKNKLKTIVLVEGPRDPLKLIQKNIPSVGILGSNNWTDTKAEILLSMDVKRVITCFDADVAGDKAKKLVYNSLKNEIEVVNFNLFKWKEKLGLEELDPGSAPPEVIEALSKHVV